jgi:peptide/nickel transport system permease protein
MTAAPPAIEATGVSRRALGRAYRRMSGLLIAGLVGLVLTVVLTLWGVQLSGFEPGSQALSDRLLPPLTNGHLLGTDQLGRDVFARVSAGFRWSVPVGVLATAIAACIGGTVGIIAGWWPGWVRSVLTRAMEVAISFPYLVLAVAIIAVTGHGFWSLTLVLGLVSWVSFARVIYAETLRIKEREYVLAARLIGNSTPRIIATYVARGLRRTFAVMYAFIFADLLVAEAGLSFLGVGAPLGEPSWGNMLSSSREYLFNAPWLMYAPAAAVVLVVLTANLLGDGLIGLWGRGTTQQ